MFTRRFNERQRVTCAPPRDSTPLAARFGPPRRARARLFAVLLAWAAATGLAAAQNVIIGDTGVEVVGISSGTTPYNTLILGNTASGDGTLNFSGGTIDVTHNGGYSGFVTVGNFGIGSLNHSNENGNAVINITGPAYVGPPPATPPDPWGGYLFIGRSNGGSGSYTMTDFGNSNLLQLNVQNEIQIGGSNVSTDPGGGFSCSATCTGAFVQGGGIVTAGGVTIGIGSGTGTYTINSGTLTTTLGLDLGNSSSGDNRFTQNGGTVNVNGMFVANAGGANGTYALNDGILNSGAFALIGLQGTGTFTQTGGAHTAGVVSLGYQAAGTGTYNLSGGTLDIGTPDGPGGIPPGTGSLLVGDVGQGSFVMTGGTLTIHNDNINIGAFIVGNQAGSVGTFTQSGGDVFGGRGLSLGQEAGSTGTYNLNTDLVNFTTPTLSAGILVLGYGGTGVFNQQAGTTNTVAAGMFIGNTNGTYNLFGGDLSVGGQGILVGVYNTGTFTQSGGTNTTTALSLGQHDVSSGTYVMSGGNLVVNGQMLVGKGDESLNPGMLNGLFQQSGGTVTASQIFIGGFSDSCGSNCYNSYLGSGRYELSGGVVNSQFTSVGFLGQGRVLQTGGTFNNTGELQLGSSGLFATPDGGGGFIFYSSGTYDLQGGILNTDTTTVGVFGQGTFNQSGTSEHHITNNLVVGSQPGLIEPLSGVARQGVYTMTGGALEVGGNTIVGGGNTGFAGEPGGKGTFNQSGGTHTITGDLIIGQGSGLGASSGATGTYVLSGGSVVVGTTTQVGGDGGPGLGGTGTFTHTGGTHTTTFLGIGGANATGTYDLSGTGVVNSGITYVGAGFGANGTLAQSGGTQNTSFLNVGFLGGATGIYNMSGGQATISDSMNVGGLPGSNGSVHQSGGNVDVAFILTVNGSGTYNLSGGSLTTFRTVVGENDTGAAFHQTGGTHTIGSNPGASNVGDQILTIGVGPGSSGTYTMSAGALTILGNSNNANSALTVGSGGTGTFIQTGGTVTAHGANSLAIGECCGGAGEYRISNGTLTTTGNAFVGAHSLGTMLQTGGAVSVGGDLLVGYGSTGVGQYTMDASAGHGASTLQVGGNVLIGVSGSAVMTMDGASMHVVPANGSVIVGATATSVATLDMKGGSTIVAGSVFGIGHDGTQSTGGTATVYVNSGSSITATNVYIGANGCLGGSGGVIHGNLIMAGATGILGCNAPIFASVASDDHVGIQGILNPGRSPGTLVIDGGFDFISGTIVLEIESDGHGGFLTDELVFTSGHLLDFTNMNIVYSFLGGANPDDFRASTHWVLDTFFKIAPAFDSPPEDYDGVSSLGDLGLLFQGTTFAAQSDAYVIEQFTFDPALGVTSLAVVPNQGGTVPEPGTLMLMLLGTLLLVRTARLRNAQARCSSHARASAVAAS